MSTTELAVEWRAWIAENLAAGHAPADIVERLVSEGLDRAVCVSAIDQVTATIDLTVVTHFVERRRSRQTIIDLQQATRPFDGIDTVESMEASRFLRNYVLENRPAYLPGFGSAWPATKKWSLRWLAAEFGGVEINVCRGRDGESAPDRNYERLVETMTLRDFVEAIDDVGFSNDLYAISNNKLMALPALQPLFDDVTPDPDLFPYDQRQPGAVALWLGPGGTTTPLHHDTSNVMLTQIQGRKRITLASPLETALADNAFDYYAETDIGTELWNERYGNVATQSVEIGPGDAILIPAGWWHRVEALEPSISFALLGFASPNNFGWYRPGSIREMAD